MNTKTIATVTPSTVTPIGKTANGKGNRKQVSATPPIPATPAPAALTQTESKGPRKVTVCPVSLSYFMANAVAMTAEVSAADGTVLLTVPATVKAFQASKPELAKPGELGGGFGYNIGGHKIPGDAGRGGLRLRLIAGGVQVWDSGIVAQRMSSNDNPMVYVNDKLTVTVGTIAVKFQLGGSLTLGRDGNTGVSVNVSAVGGKSAAR
ncbi:MAG: hypothetical protein A2Y38_16950 [Spirochaetes bacterium GWB1_59_5]|nr:MAG: hypothetical protein A2Y38_16950 [Spirochaetes bacterium GWB1_59_5]